MAAHPTAKVLGMPPSALATDEPVLFASGPSAAEGSTEEDEAAGAAAFQALIAQHPGAVEIAAGVYAAD